MGKQGPCLHCGTASTPLWRNGPPEKPVLCNACGSRYKLRGTLINYAPKSHHFTSPILKKLKGKKRKKKKKKKVKKQSKVIFHSFSGDEENVWSCSSVNELDDRLSDTSSSSEPSTTSCTDQTQSCFQIKQEDGSSKPPGGEIPECSWDVDIPSRKRSLVVYRSLSPIERLQRDLKKILKHQIQHPNYNHSNSSNNIVGEPNDGVLLYNLSNKIISPSEIGLGTVLLKENTTSL